MLMRLKKMFRPLLRHLPRAWELRAKRWYYPRLFRRLGDDAWPLIQVVRPHLQPGAVVVDVGANIGYVSWLLQGAVAPGGHVYAFEPLPPACDLLQHNLQRLGAAQVHVFNMAVSDREGQAFMSIPCFPDGRPNYYEAQLSGTARFGSLPVPVQSLDAVLGGMLQRLDLIKIDAEGHENEVVAGARRLLERYHPLLVIEIDGDPDQPSSRAAGLFQTLEKLGYRAHVPGAQAQLRPRPPGVRATDYIFLAPGRDH